MSKKQTTQPTRVQPAAKTRTPAQAHTPRLDTSRLLEAPESLRPEEILAAQQQVGNQVVQRALDSRARRQAVTDDQGNLNETLTRQIQQKRGGGSPLPEAVREEAGRKLGRNFSDVRIHTDEAADHLSRTISARAFTIGKDIFFKNGVFAPNSSAGRETIMHELTHVIQQGGRGGASGALKLGAPDTAHEKEADRMGKKHAASAGAAPAGAVQREAEEEELQMQGEEEELQMQGEEEELQMQGEEEELQMQGEEEELQMQGEEEELQAQPDAGGVVQRAKTGLQVEKDEDLGLRQLFSAPLVKDPKNNPPPLPTKGSGSKNLNTGIAKPAGAPKPGAMSFREELVSKSKKMKGNIFTRGKRFEGIEKNREAKLKEMMSTTDEADKHGKLQHAPSSTEKNVDYKAKLIATMQNPKSSPDEVKAAQEKLDLLHKRTKWDKFKSALTPGKDKREYSEQAMETRRKNLEKAAKSGDEGAFKQLKQMEEEKKKAKEAKKNEPSPALNFLKDKVGGFLKKQLLGGDKDKDKDEEKGGGVTVNLNGVAAAGAGGGGGSDSGIGAIMKEYSRVLDENKKLKEDLESARKASASAK